MEKGRLAELDSLRGLAALSVVLFHFQSFWERAKLPIWERVGVLGPLRLVSSGHEAVLLFFLMSGFVLSIPQIQGRAQSYGVFLTRRVFRIWAPYLAALALAVLGAAIFHGPLPFSQWANNTWSRPVDPMLVLQHVLFLGQYDPSQFNTAFWSLIIEMRISLIFPFVCALTLWMKPRFALGTAALITIASYLVNLRFPRYNGIVVTIHFISLFMVGILLAKHQAGISAFYRKLGRWSKAGLAGLSLLAYAYGTLGVDGNHLIVSDWLPSAGAVGIIVFTLNSVPLRVLLLTGPARYLGTISYSVYLLHGTVLFALVHLLYRQVPILAVFPLYLATTLILSAGFYRYVEKPAMDAGRWIGNYLEPAKRRNAA